MKLLSFAAILAAQAFAGLFQNEDIHQLTSANWQETIENDDENVWMVTFYADWCPYCKTFETELGNALADPALKDKRIKFGAVDVMANRDLTSRYAIKRSPTVKLFGLDKKSPLDYVGQRKAADVVTYCGDYCTEHKYVVAPTKSYEYNVEAVIGVIADAHNARIQEAEQKTYTELARIETQYAEDQQTIVEHFNARLQELVKERRDTIQENATVTEATYTKVQEDHITNIAALNKEADDTISAVYGAHHESNDLTDFIPTLGKEWFAINWDQTNRREVAAAHLPAAYGAYGETYGAPGTPGAPGLAYGVQYDAQHNDYYGAPAGPGAPDSYYGAYGQVSAPSAPHNDYGYPAGPASPNSVYGQVATPSHGYEQPAYGGYAQEQPAYGGYGGYAQEQPAYGGYGGYAQEQPAYGGYGGYAQEQPAYGGYGQQYRY